MMAISPFSAGRFASNQRTELFGTLKSQLDDLQRQFATGQKSETYGGLGFGRRISLDARAKLSNLEGYQNGIQSGQLRLKVMTESLTQISKLAGDTRGALAQIAFTPDSNGKTAAQKTAELNLRSAIDALNIDIGGRQLFSGRATDLKPVESFEHILDGDPATGRAGLKQLISERRQAELGATGLGRLSISSTGTTNVTVSGENSVPAFGFDVTSASSSGSAIVASSLTGPPPSASFDVNSQPLSGDKLSLVVKDKDGNESTIILTAAKSVGASQSSTHFAIGPTLADTTANLNTALQNALSSKAQSVLGARAATKTSEDFFSATADFPPQRVSGTPFNAATALTTGTPADTMIWYRGDTSANPRDSAPLRIDQQQTVGIGAQANEAPVRKVLAQFAALAAESFTNTPVEQARYDALSSTIRNNLAPKEGEAQIADIVTDLGSASVALKNANERHYVTKTMLEDSIEGVEKADPQEVAANILALQTRLQASYQTTAALSKLSLANYL